MRRSNILPLDLLFLIMVSSQDRQRIDLILAYVLLAGFFLVAVGAAFAWFEM